MKSKKLVPGMLAALLGIAMITGAGALARSAGDNEAVAAIEPVPTMAKALALAGEDGRLVFLMVKASTCLVCQKFDQDVVQSAEFRAFADEKLHLVVYDIFGQDEVADHLAEERKTELEEIMDKHEIVVTPTVVVLSADGRVLLRTEGYEGAPASRVVNHLARLAEAEAEAEAGQ